MTCYGRARSSITKVSTQRKGSTLKLEDGVGGSVCSFVWCVDYSMFQGTYRLLQYSSTCLTYTSNRGAFWGVPSCVHQEGAGGTKGRQGKKHRDAHTHKHKLDLRHYGKPIGAREEPHYLLLFITT